MKRFVALNERNRRIGEGHANAKLTNEDVDLILQLREDGLSLGVIAEKFEVGKAAIWKICAGHRRCQLPARWVAVNA